MESSPQISTNGGNKIREGGRESLPYLKETSSWLKGHRWEGFNEASFIHAFIHPLLKLYLMNFNVCHESASKRRADYIVVDKTCTVLVVMEFIV